ncbi:hypothetical protein BH23ACT10_BH23ACT10_05700 [soil metagenome]
MGNRHTNWKGLRRRRAIGETPESRRAYAEADRDQQLGELVYRLRTEAQRLRVAPLGPEREPRQFHDGLAPGDRDGVAVHARRRGVRRAMRRDGRTPSRG